MSKEEEESVISTLFGFPVKYSDDAPSIKDAGLAFESWNEWSERKSNETK